MTGLKLSALSQIKVNLAVVEVIYFNFFLFSDYEHLLVFCHYFFSYIVSTFLSNVKHFLTTNNLDISYYTSQCTW